MSKQKIIKASHFWPHLIYFSHFAKHHNVHRYYVAEAIWTEKIEPIYIGTCITPFIDGERHREYRFPKHAKGVMGKLRLLVRPIYWQWKFNCAPHHTVIQTYKTRKHE
jgi:hypothetical protein